MEYELKHIPFRSGESYAEYTYHLLRTNIMEFNLPPGALINELELSGALNISRTPVHEAVLRLRDEQLIDIIPRKESRVSYIDMEKANECVFLRCAVEPMLMQSVAGVLAHEYIDRFRDNLAQQEQILSEQTDLYRFYPVDDAFHKLMYMAANKPYLYAAMKRLASHQDRIRYLVRFEGGMDIEAMSYAEHKLMFQYLTFGLQPDIDLGALYKRHILRFQTNLEDYLVKYDDYFTPLASKR